MQKTLIVYTISLVFLFAGLAITAVNWKPQEQNVPAYSSIDTFTIANNHLETAISISPPPMNITFYEGDSLILKISWKNGTVVAEYDSIDIAGKLFFDWLEEYISQNYQITKIEN